MRGRAGNIKAPAGAGTSDVLCCFFIWIVRRARHKLTKSLERGFTLGSIATQIEKGFGAVASGIADIKRGGPPE